MFKSKLNFIGLLLNLLFFIVLLSCNNPTSKENSTTKEVFTIKTFKTDNIGWGYDILKENKIIIHQPNIPAIDGDQSFKTEAKAKETATLVIEKLKKNIFPPSLTKEEVDAVINK